VLLNKADRTISISLSYKFDVFHYTLYCFLVFIYTHLFAICIFVVRCVLSDNKVILVLMGGSSEDTVFILFCKSKGLKLFKLKLDFWKGLRIKI